MPIVREQFLPVTVISGILIKQRGRELSSSESLLLLGNKHGGIVGMQPVQSKKKSEPYFSDNPQVSRLPNHLLQFAVDQNYSQYTAVDHAVWRYIMRQNCHFLKENAHKVYFKGLLETGIDLDSIPSIDDMNRILGQIGWGAVAVDGFIPPVAFMEYQAYKVLVIACDMRQIHHIDYTPAPDIVHEAAGHAPIIVDSEYSAYLQRFGEIGEKAMSSKKDFELYEAIRSLSILKEIPNTSATDIASAEKLVKERQANLGEPSEMALLSRLHWWTVEFGLIGPMDKPKIYGAGLLSSIGESVTCLEDHIKKIPYSVDAASFPFDITTQQPQLFVTPDFDHLKMVLEQFADTMAFRRGGTEGLQKAIDSHNTGTAVYSSGLQVSGVFTDILTHRGDPIYLKTTGPTTLAINESLLPGHGRDYHKDGFGSPVGNFKNVPRPPEDLDDSGLALCNVVLGKVGTLAFESGIKVLGRLEKIERRNGKLLLLSFSDCSVVYGDSVLFRPDWGTYDMAIGAKIISVFSGAADMDAHEQIALVSKTRTVKVTYDDETRRLQKLYGLLRAMRENQESLADLPDLWNTVKAEHPDDWLLSLEVVELLEARKLFPELKAQVRAYLETKAKSEKEYSKLIADGLNLSGNLKAR